MGVTPNTRDDGRTLLGVPFEGPLAWIAVTVTDQRSGPDDSIASVHTNGLAGTPLPAATTNCFVALLDSGAQTHVLRADDAAALGVTGAFLTGETFTLGGLVGSATAAITVPLGFFAHGLQDLGPGQAIQPDRAMGHGNFEGAVADAPEATGPSLPSVLGAPLLASFPALIRNSLPVHLSVGGEPLASPSVTLFGDAASAVIPRFQHKVQLQIFPLADGIAYAAGDEMLGLPPLPSMITLTILPGLAASLFLTVPAVELRESSFTDSDPMVVDTGAQATLISRTAADQLGLNLSEPDFWAEVGGVGGVTNVPGFYIDQLRLPAQPTAIFWTNVPVIVANVAGPDGSTLFGILGSNLLGDRDLVFNGAAASPYLDVSDPVVAPVLSITALQVAPDGGVGLDWWNEPAPGRLVLHAARDLAGGTWDTIATAALSTLRGTLTVPNAADYRFFRLAAP
jgi:hypothetical protein